MHKRSWCVAIPTKFRRAKRISKIKSTLAQSTLRFILLQAKMILMKVKKPKSPKAMSRPILSKKKSRGWKTNLETTSWGWTSQKTNDNFRAPLKRSLTPMMTLKLFSKTTTGACLETVSTLNPRHTLLTKKCSDDWKTKLMSFSGRKRSSSAYSGSIKLLTTVMDRKIGILTVTWKSQNLNLIRNTENQNQRRKRWKSGFLSRKVSIKSGQIHSHARASTGTMTMRC